SPCAGRGDACPGGLAGGGTAGSVAVAFMTPPAPRHCNRRMALLPGLHVAAWRVLALGMPSGYAAGAAALSAKLLGECRNSLRGAAVTTSGARLPFRCPCGGPPWPEPGAHERFSLRRDRKPLVEQRQPQR